MENKNVIYMWNTIEYYFSYKENEIMNFAGIWMKLEKIILSEITQIPRSRNVSTTRSLSLELGTLNLQI